MDYRKRPTSDSPGLLGISELPIELLSYIFSFLPQSSLTSVARVSKEWKEVAYMLCFWKDIDLSLCSLSVAKSPLLLLRLRHAKSLTVDRVEVLPEILCYACPFDTISSLTLSNCPAVPENLYCLVFSAFRRLCQVDLSSNFHVGSFTVTSLIEYHRDTLTSINVARTSIKDETLVMFASVTNLHHLNIASCYNLSLRGMQTFLQGQLPSTLESLNISWLFCVRGSWLTQMKEDMHTLKWLDVRGIDDLTRRDIQAIQYRFLGIQILLHEPLLDDNSVESYLAFVKRYVQV